MLLNFAQINGFVITWIHLSCYMDLSKLIHGLLFSCYIDLSKLILGFFQVVTWICQSFSCKSFLGKFTWVDHPTLCISAPSRVQHQNENMPTSQSLDCIKYQHKITKSWFCFGTDGKGRVKETLLYISRFMDTILVTQIYPPFPAVARNSKISNC